MNNFDVKQFKDKKIKVLKLNHEIDYRTGNKTYTLNLEHDLFLKIDMRYLSVAGYKKGDYKRDKNILKLLRTNLIEDCNDLTFFKKIIESELIRYADFNSATELKKYEQLKEAKIIKEKAEAEERFKKRLAEFNNKF